MVTADERANDWIVGQLILQSCMQGRDVVVLMLSVVLCRQCTWQHPK